MNIKPLGDNIIVRKLETETLTPGGLIVPDGEQPDQGTVISVGKSAKKVKVGDVVLFGKRLGKLIRLSDGDLWLLSESLVLGVL